MKAKGNNRWFANWHWKGGRNNTFKDERSVDFAVALSTGFVLARVWQVVDLDGHAHVTNWRFEDNAPAGDPGVVWIDHDGEPGISMENCHITRCNLRLIDVILDLVREAQDA